MEIDRVENNAVEGVIDQKPRLDASDGWPFVFSPSHPRLREGSDLECTF